eukprot:1147203-Pelagomonas_calceolata.AAC.1
MSVLHLPKECIPEDNDDVCLILCGCAIQTADGVPGEYLHVAGKIESIGKPNSDLTERSPCKHLMHGLLQTKEATKVVHIPNFFNAMACESEGKCGALKEMPDRRISPSATQSKCGLGFSGPSSLLLNRVAGIEYRCLASVTVNLPSALHPEKLEQPGRARGPSHLQMLQLSMQIGRQRNGGNLHRSYDSLSMRTWREMEKGPL